MHRAVTESVTTVTESRWPNRGQMGIYFALLMYFAILFISIIKVAILKTSTHLLDYDLHVSYTKHILCMYHTCNVHLTHFLVYEYLAH